LKIAPRLTSLAFSALLAAVAAAETPAPPPAPIPERAAPVTFDGATLYEVRGFMGILTPEERAKLAERKIRQLADDPFYSPELFTSDEADGATTIRYGDGIVGMVTKDDALVAGAPSDEVATNRLAIVKQAIARHREAQMPRAKIRALVIGLIATVLLVLLLHGIRGLYQRTAAYVERSRSSRVFTLLEEHLKLAADRVVAVEIHGLKLARLAVTLIVVVIYLQVVFSFVPLTRGYALSVLSYLLEPLQKLLHGFLRNIGDLFTILVLVVLTRYALKGIRWVLHEAAAGRITIPGLAGEWGVPLYKIVRIVVIALAAVMIYPYIPGSDTAAFKGLSLFAGALFTLGASGTIGNFIGGLVAIFVGTFRIGDVVKIGSVLGVVTETTMVLTRIRTPKNEIVSVPNISILNGEVVNYSTMAREQGVILHTSVTIGYDAPWRTVHELLLEAAARTSRIETTPAPFVLQKSLDDFYVCYQINAFTREPAEMIRTYSELHQNIQDAFNARGVEIMSPHYASLRDGNTVTIPEGERPKDYAAPRFGVRIDGSDGGRG
jgi:small-conductance mechanosensitive channel